MSKEIENAIKVSVIIPVYNTEKYLEECLNSIINQTLKEIEIIIINDGSTDSSTKILEEFAQKDNRIKIFSQDNLGVSVARNIGIKKATGEYIGFVDSDDFIDTEYFEKLYLSAKKHNADIAAASILRLKKHKQKFLLKFNKESYTSNIQKKYKLLKLPNWSFSCCKIYKTSSLMNSNILFKEGVFYEDIVFTNKIVHKLKKLVVVPNIKYYYRIHSNSITNKITAKHKYDAKMAAIEIQRFVQNEKTLKGIGKHWYGKILNEIKILNIPIFQKILYGHYILYKIFKLPIFYLQIHKKFKIDLVHCWVNGNDNSWQTKRNYWAKKYNIKIDEYRYIDNNELKFSLRSINDNAKWINKIYIITDSQIPEFLDINNSKIKIIDHNKIIPKENLPTFNSEMIESFMDLIPKLSEYFLYANDDTFIGKPLKSSYFFNKDGKPIVYIKPHKWKNNLCCYQKNIIYSANLIKKIYNKDFTHYEPHHNIDAYRKSYILECKQIFSKEFEKLQNCKFREENSITRHIYTLFMLANNLCDYKILKRKLLQNKSMLISTFYPAKYIFNQIKKYKPNLFCINDVETGTYENRKSITDLLEKIFPNKAEWEK